jgi:hypothetical protein
MGAELLGQRGSGQTLRDKAQIEERAPEPVKRLGTASSW